jgi:hypothetical protein
MMIIVMYCNLWKQSLFIDSQNLVGDLKGRCKLTENLELKYVSRKKEIRGT